MSKMKIERRELVSQAMEDIRALIKEQGVTSPALGDIKNILVALTRETDFFGEEQYPSPSAEEYAKIYLLSEDDGGDNSLYLISTKPLGPSPVHNHGTWAVIAGLKGDEENTVYNRLDDSDVVGKATLEVNRKVVISQGDAIAFMPDDIHHIQATSKVPTRHFHLYGKGFDQQTDRLEFNLTNDTTKIVSGSFIPVDDSRRIL